MRDFQLSARHLRNLRSVEVENRHYKSPVPMRFFLLEDIKALAQRLLRVETFEE